MSEPWLIAMVSVLIGGLLGIFGTLAAARYTHRLQTEEIPLEYDLSRTSLVPQEIGRSPLKLFVERGAELEPVQNAYSFSVRVVNKGRVVVDNPYVRITPDPGVVILQPDTVPISRDGYEVTQEPGLPSNVIAFTFPWLNAGDQVSVTFTAIGLANPACQVLVEAKGARAVDRRQALVEALEGARRLDRIFLPVMRALVLIASGTALLGFLAQEGFLGQDPSDDPGTNGVRQPAATHTPPPSPSPTLNR